MQPDPESSPKSRVKSQSNFLLICSIVNILIFPLCVGLEAGRLVAGQGVWGSITFFVAGLLGFSASYKPTKPMIISTTVFSSLSICFALISGCITWAGAFRDCIYFQNYPGVCFFRVNPLVLTFANLVSFVNNIIVTVVLSKLVCKCCASSDSSVPVPLVVHNPPQPTPMWVIPPDGQQPQFQSYPMVVYSPYQQQPVPQQGQQQWQADQHPSAPSNLPTASSTDPVSLANPSPPPYSTAAALLEPLKNKNLDCIS
ncbi:uncharacterized protein LOC124349351 [Daphnia pulicaria]|uniref:uncharacterized protein LOC124349351 n=1 Tax=Daphnia pulicaria TaxID=35523 RepID=UPI001EECE080|nr:uncharacterized protein LOC124349351 [Daphnia pulicaria]XP_046655795.1 uncharacterized protein LOC124349351 [Daphnia pulicaria]XP_046655797.1 uncharacterized protein LOC124349351 [Daphnia pulicaria]